MEVKIGEKIFVIRELLAIELDDIDFADSKNAIKKQVLISTGMNEEQYNKLTVKERTAILKAITELNYPDFQSQPK